MLNDASNNHTLTSACRHDYKRVATLLIRDTKPAKGLDSFRLIPSIFDFTHMKYKKGGLLGPLYCFAFIVEKLLGAMSSGL